jgi:hypothetical protein
MADEATAELVLRLSRPHESGGRVIERSVILAEGAESRAILGWISDHDGVGDSSQATARGSGGLHGGRRDALHVGSDSPARRFVLPASAFE